MDEGTKLMFFVVGMFAISLVAEIIIKIVDWYGDKLVLIVRNIIAAMR